MSNFLTSTKLIRSIKRRAAIPENQETFTTEDFLEFANEELINDVVPDLMRKQEDYLLYSVDVPLVTNKARYRIPTRAIGTKLRDLAFVDQQGNVYEMTRVGVEDISDYNGGYASNRAYAFYVENSEVVLTPSQATPSNGNLRFIFYIRPNALVEETKTRQITGIADGTDSNGNPTKIVSFSTTPDDFTGSALYDVIKNATPFEHLAIDLTPLSIPINNQLTFLASQFSDEIEVGDWLCLAEESPVPQLPQEYHSVLAHKVAMRCLEAQGDLQGLQMAQAKNAQMEDRMNVLFDDRVESAPRKVVNRHSLLRSGLRRRVFSHRRR